MVWALRLILGMGIVGMFWLLLDKPVPSLDTLMGRQPVSANAATAANDSGVATDLGSPALAAMTPSTSAIRFCRRASMASSTPSMARRTSSRLGVAGGAAEDVMILIQFLWLTS